MRLKKAAIVRFIGLENDYRLACEKSSFRYCRDCEENKKCSNKDFKYEFTKEKEYVAYFLEYWQGVRNSLHVKGNTGEIVDFIPFEDFKVTKDEDNVLNNKEAIVKCVSKEYEESLLDIKYGNEYKALGINKNRDNILEYLVMDESYDCYFYPCNYFIIIEDNDNILNENNGLWVYDKSMFSE